MSGSLRQRLQDVSIYLVLLVVIATLGPLQFGYHLVSFNTHRTRLLIDTLHMSP